MPSAFSLQKIWLPQCRSIFFQRILFRSSFSNSTNSEQISSSSSQQRSESRFALKIARFQFSKTRYPTSASLSTHAHYTKSETSGDVQDLARAFVLSLEPEHRRILSDELINAEKNVTTMTNPVIPILPSQLAFVFLETGLPYIGFGFVDNFVMLVAGETIETFFGATFCLSTMAAAGLGNAVSDVMGIGLADRIERTCGRFLALFGINPPKLTKVQWTQKSVRTTQLWSKVICIFLGCILGMCPLLIRDTSAKHPNEKD